MHDLGISYADLKRTLGDALASGEIGTPVALRLSVQRMNRQADVAAELAAVMKLTDGVFRSGPATMSARQSRSGDQWNVLMRCATGETISLTLGRGATEGSRLYLVLVGNHGIVQLENSPLADAPLDIPLSEAERWRDRMAECLNQHEWLQLKTR